MKLLIIIISALSLSSCMTLSHRDYLAEMEHDDSTLFQAREDFPIVAGDTGEDWRSDENWKLRTPASESQIAEERYSRSLTMQLSKLENAQSEGARLHYEKFKPHLASESERIYFLSLRGRQEREEYLAARGITETSMIKSHLSQLGRDINAELALGMSKSDIEESWGEPYDVEYAGNPNHENERWLYRKDGAVKYIYFEAGRVGGWSTASR
jgi:hypothetical protein